MNELLFYESGISGKCFIKITPNIGVTFGEMQFQLVMGDQKPEPPTFKPATTDNNFNSFHLHKIQDEKKIDDLFIEENKLIEFITKNHKLHREIIQVIFNPETNLNV